MKSEERIVKNTKKKKPLTRLFFLEAPPGIGPGNKGFADLCLTAWLWRRYSNIGIIARKNAFVKSFLKKCEKYEKHGFGVRLFKEF